MKYTIHLPANHPFSTAKEKVFRVEKECRERAIRVLPNDTYTFLDALSVVMTHEDVSLIVIINANGLKVGSLHYSVIACMRKDGEP